MCLKASAGAPSLLFRVVSQSLSSSWAVKREQSSQVHICLREGKLFLPVSRSSNRGHFTSRIRISPSLSFSLSLSLRLREIVARLPSIKHWQLLLAGDPVSVLVLSWLTCLAADDTGYLFLGLSLVTSPRVAKVKPKGSSHVSNQAIHKASLSNGQTKQDLKGSSSPDVKPVSRGSMDCELIVLAPCSKFVVPRHLGFIVHFHWVDRVAGLSPSCSERFCAFGRLVPHKSGSRHPNDVSLKAATHLLL